MSMPTDLIGRMTLAEKIGQLTMVTADYAVTGPVVAGDVTGALRDGRVGSVFNLFGRQETRETQRIALEETRLGIPLFFGFDVLHGFRTVFPVPIAEAGSFDPALWEQTAREAAEESLAAGLDLVFAPMLDIARDPRWGRIVEGPGEDPVVGSLFARAKVRGFQGEGLSRVAATAKHFAAYGACLAGRDYAQVDISERALAEVYLPPFRAAIDAGVVAMMAAFNDIAAIPVTADRALLQGRLREEWGFSGVIMSDYNAIAELIPHGVAADLTEAAALALKAGVDIDMMAYAYEKGLPEALRRGLVTEEDIDAAVARVLDLKARLGLFDDPYRGRTQADAGVPSIGDQRRLAARTAAGRSLVLLKNARGALPFPSKPASLALVGPLADAAREMIGPWSGAGRGEEAVSVLAGLRMALPDTRIDHVAGVPVEGGDGSGIARAVALAKSADHVVLCLGEAAWMSGEAASRARMDLPGHQKALAEALFATGKPVIVLLFSGRPIAMPEVFERAAAVVACWFPGTEAGQAIADLLTGRIDASGRLAVTWPRDVGQVPIFYAERSGGRPIEPDNKYTSKYLDMPNSPEFVFGHGLSYTSFGLGAPQVSGNGPFRVETTVTNEGARAGTTTVFVFIRDPVASVARPVLELKRFETVTLGPGEKRPLSFALERQDFAFLDRNLEPVVEPGEIEIHVGFSADPAQLQKATLRIA